ncbi:MAG: hypothetical protein J6T96_07065 [Bacteroidales bacterium]|nr:hypothetical protein [Bacteroidales bacterium]
MFLNLYNQQIKVFLADATGDMSGVRMRLERVLRKAGMGVVSPPEHCTAMEARTLISTCDCSVHLLGGVNIFDDSDEGVKSQAQIQYRAAKSFRDDDFKMFLWNPSGFIDDRNAYITAIRRDIVENTVYSQATSPIVFVEDLRTVMSINPKMNLDIGTADIFFIYNDADRDTAVEVLSMLQDIQQVTSLGINMSSTTSYTDYINTQLQASKMGVIYFDDAMDWAMPFARQLWKDSGGKSSNVPLFVAANSAHATEQEMKALKGFMDYTLTEKSLIPLEIKVYFDKKMQTHQKNF